MKGSVRKIAGTGLGLRWDGADPLWDGAAHRLGEQMATAGTGMGQVHGVGHQATGVEELGILHQPGAAGLVAGQQLVGMGAVLPGAAPAHHRGGQVDAARHRVLLVDAAAAH